MNLIYRKNRGTFALHRLLLLPDESIFDKAPHMRERVTNLEKELSKMSVYSPGFLTFSSPWIVSLWELQRVSGIKTYEEQRMDILFDIKSRESPYCIQTLEDLKVYAILSQ